MSSITAEVVADYLKGILRCYNDGLGKYFKIPRLPAHLAVDNGRCHSGDERLFLMKSMNVNPVWLPGHSTDFIQALAVLILANHMSGSCFMTGKKT
jgi:hypothetical protein